MRVLRTSVAVLALSFMCAFVASHSASADDAPPIAPIEVTVVGEGAVRVRIAEGTTAPCDSPDDKPLINALVRPNKPPLVVPTEAMCVCWEQTYYPFTDLGWSPTHVACRPMECGPSAKPKKCKVLMSTPWKLVLSSREQP
jgi:hypothetical protein